MSGHTQRRVWATGLTAANLIAPPSSVAGEAAGWYEGPTLLQALDNLASRVRTDGPASVSSCRTASLGGSNGLNRYVLSQTCSDSDMF